MPLLPPATKLTLVERKNIRDEWEANKPRLETELNDLVGPGWTIDVDPLVIAPYVAASDSYAGRPGDVINGYIEEGLWSLKHFVNDNATAKTDLNAIVIAHSLAIEPDAEDKYTYCGPVVKDGRLVIVFNPEQLWTNTSDALRGDVLLAALSAAEAAGGNAGMSAITRAAIAKDWEPKADALQKDFAAVLNNPDIKLEPAFEAAYAALKAAPAKDGVRDDWERALPAATRAYFEGALWRLKSEKFDSDDLLQEAFSAVVTSNTIAFRVVAALSKASYCEAEIESGTLYIQTVPKKWYSNVDAAFDKIVDVISDAEANL